MVSKAGKTDSEILHKLYASSSRKILIYDYMTKESNELISVIIPTYNRGKWLTPTLNSVFEQTYRPIELIVVDDGSTDDTNRIIETWKNEKMDGGFKVMYVFQKNSGAPMARNTGLKNAKGKYVQFFDSDDFLIKNKIELQVLAMQKENTVVSICDYVHINACGKILKTNRNNKSLNSLIKGFSGQHTAAGLINREFLIKNNVEWNPKLRKRQDTDFYTKLFMIVPSFSYVNQTLFKWLRDDKDGITNSIKLKSSVYIELIKSNINFYRHNYRKIPANRLLAIIRYNLFLLAKSFQALNH